MSDCKLCGENSKIIERGLCEECSVYSDEQVLKNNLFSDIQKTKENVNYKEEAFLRKFGWDCSCSFPGALWLWVKTIRGITMATSRDNAIIIEMNIEHFKKREQK
ncbi:MAG: hypothetical protein JXA96_17240 [Sedimentisphaerales bacterium]|nr:hypothetical protein [Sedimentisphaerales bacterium]